MFDNYINFAYLAIVVINPDKLRMGYVAYTSKTC